ncbi:MAG: hypothetical protein MUP47_07940 [Phycisphaerae bacterium]|nr:hypothetical protein [Phycisphaerae bacterium]
MPERVTAVRTLRCNFCLALAAAVLLTAVALPAQGNDGDVALATFRQGVAQYKAKEFVVAKSTFLKVDRGQLSVSDRASLDEYLSKIDQIIRRQTAAMSAYDAGVKALRDNEWVRAKDQFQIAADSEYLPEAVRRDARAQLALVTKQLAAMPPAPPPAVTTRPAVTTQPAASEVRVELPPTTMPAATQPAVAPGELPPRVPDRRTRADALLAEGKQALAANDAAGAAIKFEQALTLAPELDEARELLAQTRAQTAPPPGPLTVLEQKRQIKRQQVDVEFDTSLKRASDLLLTAGSTADFEASSEAAHMAENVIQANRDLYATGEYRDRLAEVARRLDGIQTRRSEWDRDQVRKQLDQMSQAEAERVTRVREQLDQQVGALTDQARTLREEQKYKQSLEVVKQILRLEPTNAWAAEHEGILEQLILVQEQHAILRERDTQDELTYRDRIEADIPWYDPIVFPRNWREQAQQREGKGIATLGWEEDRRIRQLLREGLKESLDLDMETSLGEVLQKLEKDMGISVRVKWKYLETLGYSEDGTKVGPVRLGRVTNEKALRVILEDASGPYVGDPNELSYVIDEGELTISTKFDLSRAVVLPEALHVRVYDTRDILRGWSWASRSFGALGGAPTEEVLTGAGGDSNAGGGGGAPEGGEGAGEPNFEEEPNNRLISVIRSSVDPSSWDPSGPARVTIWDDRLVVRQTAANHVAVADLINELRRAKETQVSIEAKFVRVSSGYFENIATDLDFYLNFNSDHLTDLTLSQYSSSFSSGVLNPGVTGIAQSIGNPAIRTSGIAYLDDIQVTFLLEATQAHEDTRTLTAPRLTLMSGTQAQIWVGETRQYVTDWEITWEDPNSAITGDEYWVAEPTVTTAQFGTNLLIDASVSGDLKYVTLRIRPSINTLVDMREVAIQVGGGPVPVSYTLELLQRDIQTLDTTVTVPDGGTLLLGGLKKFAEAEREMGVPVLSKIPIINRAFANRAKTRDDSTLLILIKPTIIVPRDDENRLFPSFP